VSSQESLQLFTNRYKGGVDTYLHILRRRLDASVLLVKALGGGWTVSNLPTFGASSVRDYCRSEGVEVPDTAGWPGGSDGLEGLAVPRR
jgi:hypothetical protein